MIEVLPGGFCFLCNAEFKENWIEHRANVHPGEDFTLRDDRYNTPEYNAYLKKT